MTTWTKNLTRFTTLMVAVMVLLGMAVSGCSSKDRNANGTPAVKADLTYEFSVPQSVTPEQKATYDATHVIVTAVDAQGNELDVEQETYAIAEHEDITPEGYTGGKIYMGEGIVNGAAAGDKITFTFSYLNDEGTEVGEPDVVTSTVADDATVLACTDFEEPVQYAAIKVAEKDTDVSAITDEIFAALPAEFDVYKGDNEFIVVGQIASEEGNTYEVAEDATLQLAEDNANFEANGTTITVKDTASVDDTCALRATCDELTQDITVTVKPDEQTYLCVQETSGKYTLMTENSKVYSHETVYTKDLIICERSEAETKQYDARVEYEYQPIGTTVESFTVDGTAADEFTLPEGEFGGAKIVASYKKVVGYDAAHQECQFGGGK